MKNLVLSMLAIASISVLSSCSNESDVIDEVTGGNQDKVEIKVAAGVLKAETKAPVDGTDPVEVSILRKDGTDTWVRLQLRSTLLQTQTTSSQVVRSITKQTPPKTHFSSDFIRVQHPELR